MKKLYFVLLYSHKQNAYARILLSVNDGDNIEYIHQQALDSFDGVGYRVSDWRFICNTPDDIYTEL